MICLFKSMNNLTTYFLIYSYSLLRVIALKKYLHYAGIFSLRIYIYILVEVAGLEPAVTLYKSTTVTPTTAPQTKINPPKGGCLFGGN